MRGLFVKIWFPLCASLNVRFILQPLRRCGAHLVIVGGSLSDDAGWIEIAAVCTIAPNEPIWLLRAMAVSRYLRQAGAITPWPSVSRWRAAAMMSQRKSLRPSELRCVDALGERRDLLEFTASGSSGADDGRGLPRLRAKVAAEAGAGAASTVPYARARVRRCPRRYRSSPSGHSGTRAANISNPSPSPARPDVAATSTIFRDHPAI
jgi:hypothetical protein